jgi:nicotinamide mononucleotide transporter
LLQTIASQLHETPFLEWLAFIFGVAQVVLAWQNKTSNFVAGLLSVFLYTYLFYSNGLYAESMLNAYYVLISVAGLWMWKKENHSLKLITNCRKNEWFFALVVCLFLFLALRFVLSAFTNSTVPNADALVSALAWTGAYLLVQRKLENWLWLSASNLLAIPLLLYKNMPLTALLTIIYLVVGGLGYIAWRRLVPKTLA